jgi:hypothetical protein
MAHLMALRPYLFRGRTESACIRGLNGRSGWFSGLKTGLFGELSGMAGLDRPPTSRSPVQWAGREADTPGSPFRGGPPIGSARFSRSREDGTGGGALGPGAGAAGRLRCTGRGRSLRARCPDSRAEAERSRLGSTSPVFGPSGTSRGAPGGVGGAGESAGRRVAWLWEAAGAGRVAGHGRRAGRLVARASGVGSPAVAF